MAASRSIHYVVVLHILCYIKDSLFHNLYLSSQFTLEHAYSDANWVEDPTNCHSTTSYCFLLGTSLIFQHKKKQFVTARFSIETEYHALVDTTYNLLWLHRLLLDMGTPQTGITPLHCDSHSTIHIAHNDVFHKHIKHIEIDMVTLFITIYNMVVFSCTLFTLKTNSLLMFS